MFRVCRLLSHLSLHSSVQRRLPRTPYALCLITDPGSMPPGDVVERVKKAVAGGVTCVQFRHPSRADQSPSDHLQESLTIAQRLQEMLQKSNVPLIVNNNITVARMVGARGVHLGQTDASPAQARKELGEKAIIGLTVSTLDQIREAERLGIVSYFGIQIWASTTKPEGIALGMEFLREACALTTKPILALGGITPTNCAAVYEKVIGNGGGVAAIGPLWRTPETTAGAMKAVWHKMIREEKRS